MSHQVSPWSSVLTLVCRHYHKNTISALAWSPNGNMVASASRDQTCRVFDIRAMKEFSVLKGHKKEVNGMHLQPQLSILVLTQLHLSCSMASYPPHRRLWRIGRVNPSLGLIQYNRIHFFALPNPSHCTPSHPLTGSRFKRLVTDLPSPRPYPRIRFKRSHNSLLVQRTTRRLNISLLRRRRETS